MPASPPARGTGRSPAYLKEDALKEMDAGGVDAAILTPHTPWDPNANELCIEAVRAPPDRFAILGNFALDKPVRMRTPQRLPLWWVTGAMPAWARRLARSRSARAPAFGQQGRDDAPADPGRGAQDGDVRGGAGAAVGIGTVLQLGEQGIQVAGARRALPVEQAQLRHEQEEMRTGRLGGARGHVQRRGLQGGPQLGGGEPANACQFSALLSLPRGLSRASLSPGPRGASRGLVRPRGASRGGRPRNPAPEPPPARPRR
jgi:hypothetical protein